MSGKVKPFDDDDMSNFAFDKYDNTDEKSDDELLDDWSTEGPEDEKDKKGKGSEEDDE